MSLEEATQLANSTTWFDYTNQCWVENGVYVDVGLGKDLAGTTPTSEIIAEHFCD